MMKYLSTLFVTFIATTVFSQNVVETRTANLMDGDYTLNGTVYLELYDDNTLNLRFDGDYMTQSNVFDVHVFLSNDNDYTMPIDTTGMLLVENIGTISGLNYSSGPMTFSLPAGTGINDYQYIVFICVQFGQLHWGDGTFGESVMTGTSSIEEVEGLTATVYPNPLEDDFLQVRLENNQEDVLIEILNVQGSVVSSAQYSGSQELYHIELKEEPGVYFLRLTSDGVTTVQKVIKT